MSRTIVFDFDGTLAVGHGPVMAFATCVAPASDDAYVARVEAALADYDAGRSPYRDGYHIVSALAEEVGVDAAVLQDAYTRSRDLLGTADAPVDTIEQLDEFLAQLGAHATVVLATNAPAAGIERVLDSWGVRARFDEIHVSVGKPAGLTPIIERALQQGPVLAIGDIVEFDLAPALALGADTALVGATAATSTASVTMRGQTLTELRPDIEAWAATAVSSTQAP